jgi:hypothetical protein
MMQAWADYLDRLRVGRGELAATDGVLSAACNNPVDESRSRKRPHGVPTAQLELSLGLRS